MFDRNGTSLLSRSRTLAVLLSCALASSFAGRVTSAASLDGTVLRETLVSDAIDEGIHYEIYLPPGHRTGEGLPYLLFLPGLKDRESFCRKKGFFKLTEEQIELGRIQPIAVVCVSRGHGFWIDSYDEKMHYETALVRDLLGRLEKVHGFSHDPWRRGILGISFGGYAALKISLRFPSLFGTVAAFSPAIDPRYEDRVRAHQDPFEIKDPKTRLKLYGPTYDEQRALHEDPYFLVKNMTEPIRAHYYLTCGLDDRHGLAKPLAIFRDLLTQAGARVRGGLEPGNHDTSFWLRVYPPALAFTSVRLAPAGASTGAASPAGSGGAR